VRVSFAGGGTDVSPYCEAYGGCVVNVTINKYAWGTLEMRKDSKIIIHSADFNQILKFSKVEDMSYDGKLDLIKSVIKHMNGEGRGIDIFLRSDIPPKTGLGSSATAFLAVIGLFNHLKADKKLTDYEMAELAFKLEREELENKGGRQDQYSSVFGGLNFIEFKGRDFVRVNPLKISPSSRLELEKNMVLAYVGKRDASGDILSDQIGSVKVGKSDVVNALNESKELAVEVKQALIRGDLEDFGLLLDCAWKAKKRFSPLISNKRIDKIYYIAKKHGALGGKVSGAGGGGHMFFYCKPNTEHVVSEKLSAAGASIVPFSFDEKGLVTWEVKEKQ